MTVSISLPTSPPDASQGRPWNMVDYTTLSSIERCETWGMVRYVHHRTFQTAGRSTALEAGAAVHDAIAAARMFQLDQQGLPEHAAVCGRKLMGTERFDAVQQWFHGRDDVHTRRRNVALEALYTYGYVDDPRDKRRTLANIEESLMGLLDWLDWEREIVWVADRNDPNTLVGIEVPFCLDVRTDAGQWWYVGRIDGINVDADDGTTPVLQEYKTAWRLDDAWQQGFEMSHQVSGYSIACGLLTDSDVSSVRTQVVGVAIPRPRQSQSYPAVAFVETSRPQHKLNDFSQWLEQQTDNIVQWYSDPTEAPKRTHSCTRFFKPCPLLPLCNEPTEDRREIFNQEMIDEEFNVLEGAELIND